MTTQEAIEILRDTPIDIRSTREDDIHTLYATAQGMAIEALQHDCEKVAESSDDYITIKRQFVLDAIDIGLGGYITDDDKLTLEGMGIAVSEMPSAKPERKGEWVCFGMNKLCCLDCGEIAFERKNYCANCGRKMSKEVRHFKCMDCGKIFNELMDICPNCGADMRGERDD